MLLWAGPKTAIFPARETDVGPQRESPDLLLEEAQFGVSCCGKCPAAETVLGKEVTSLKINEEMPHMAQAPTRTNWAPPRVAPAANPLC